jgi:Flp pilus assembly protein TadD
VINKRANCSLQRWVIFGVVLSAASQVLGASVTNASPSAATTFNKDVAPIVFQHCSVCHRPGQSAPFNLLNYADVQKRAKQISEVVGKGYMPPWLPEKGHGVFAGDRSLAAAQIETIRRWYEQGAAEGNPADLPPPPKFVEGWQLGKPDLVVQMPSAYNLPPDGKDIYRNFVVPIPVSVRKYVRGVEFAPGNWKVVHHSFINVDSTPYSRRLAQKENPPAFEGMVLPSTAIMPGGQHLAWQPGKVPSFSPDGLGWTLEPNSDLVLQLHIHPSGKPEPVQASVALYFTDRAPTNTGFRLNLNPLLIDIPAGAKDYVVEDKYRLTIDCSLIGISPHAHYLAKRMEGYAIFPDGRRQDLILIKDWDFNWQGDYQYAKPVFLPKGTLLGMRFSYDNSSDNVRNPNQPPKRVKYGLQTTDEMAELWLQLLPTVPSDLKVLGADFYAHLAKSALDYNEHVVIENPNDFEAHTRAGRARAFFGQVPEALAHYNAAVKANPNYDRAWYEIGFMNMRQNRFNEAQAAFERVVLLNHDDYEAEGSLGIIFMQKGDIPQAESHLRAALRINPDDKFSQANLDRVLSYKAAQKRGNP